MGHDRPRILLSGDLDSNSGPAVVNRAYREFGSDWLLPVQARGRHKALWDTARRRYPGVLVSSSSAYHVLLMLVCRVLGTPGWYLCHGLARREMRMNRTFSLKHLVVETLTIRLAGGIVCVSESMRDELLAVFPGKAAALHVVANGAVPLVPLPTTTARAPAVDVVQVMTVGTRPIKNVPTLVEAVNRLADPRVRLLVVGDRRADDSLLGTFADQVTWIDRLGHAALLEEMGRSHIYAQVSLVEPFGLAICEAISVGCVPLLARSAGCLPHLGEIEEDTIIDDPTDVDTVAACLRTLVARVVDGTARLPHIERTWQVASGELETAVGA